MRATAPRGRGQDSGGARWNSRVLCVFLFLDFTPHVLQTLGEARKLLRVEGAEKRPVPVQLTFSPEKEKEPPGWKWSDEQGFVPFRGVPACRSRGLGVGTRAGSPSPWLGPSRESTLCSSNPCPSTMPWSRGANSSNGRRWARNVTNLTYFCCESLKRSSSVWSDWQPTCSPQWPHCCEGTHDTQVCVDVIRPQIKRERGAGVPNSAR